MKPLGKSLDSMKEILICLCQTVYEKFHYLTNECCLLRLQREDFGKVSKLEKDLYLLIMFEGEVPGMSPGPPFSLY